MTKPPLWSAIPAFLAAVLASLPATVVLFFDASLRRYDALSYRAHAPAVRRAVPWNRSTAALSPILPAVPVVVASMAGGPLHTVLPLILSVGLAEVYAVLLHRSVWIPEFEPEYMLSERPFGIAPHNQDHARIQAQFHAVATFGLGLLGVVISAWTLNPATTLVALPFVLKYLGFSAGQGEFEVAVHWDMHIDALRLPGAPLRTRLIRGLMNYVVGPLHGYVPNIYRANHLFLHHPANSSESDPHSPLPYNRASYLEFCFFSMKMSTYLLGGIDVYQSRAPRRARIRVVVSVLTYWLAVWVLWLVVLPIAVWLVIAALYRAVTATRSQYVWHGLAEPSERADGLRTTILWMPSRRAWLDVAAAGRREPGSVRPPLRSNLPAVIPSPGSHWAFYDNLHLIHHLWPGADFSSYPALLEHAVSEIEERGVAILELRAMPTFAVDCWSRRLDRIADHLICVPVGADPVGFLETRLAPSLHVRSRVALGTESTAGKALDRLIASALQFGTRARPVAQQNA